MRRIFFTTFMLSLFVAGSMPGLAPTRARAADFVLPAKPLPPRQPTKKPQAAKPQKIIVIIKQEIRLRRIRRSRHLRSGCVSCQRYTGFKRSYSGRRYLGGF